MPSGRTIRETELRGTDFYLSETRVTSQGEVDLHRPWDPTALHGVEIRVELERKLLGAGRQRLDFKELTVRALDANGEEEVMRVLDDTNRSLEAEMVEVIGWEKLEDADPEILEGYMESRLPARDANGALLAAGGVIHHPRPSEEEPHPVPA